MSTNTAWTIPGPPSPSSPSLPIFEKRNLPIPIPGPKEVLIRVKAASLNFRDHLVAINSPAYPLQHDPNLVPCCDGAGPIAAVGPESAWEGKEGAIAIVHPSTWLTGDARGFDLTSVMGAGNCQGTLQEYVVISDERVVLAPKNWTVEEASTSVTAGVTALGGLESVGKGDWVLTQGTGGVSMFGIQIATALGATVIGTSSSDEKLDFVKSIGAKHVINYRTTPDWDEEVLRITQGRGVDRVLEVGGASTIAKSLASLRYGGTAVSLGMLSEGKPTDLVSPILYGAKTVIGKLGVSRDLVREFVKVVEEYDFHPVIAKTFEFDEAPEAFELMRKQSAIGKIVVKVGGK